MARSTARDDDVHLAVILIGVWSLAGFLVGAYGVAERVSRAHAVETGGRIRHLLPYRLSLLFWLAWLATVLLLVLAVILGAGAMRRAGHGVVRTGVFVLVVALGVLGEMWAYRLATRSPSTAILARPLWRHDGTIGFAVMCLLSAAVFGISYVLARPPHAEAEVTPPAVADQSGVTPPPSPPSSAS